jgi:hypothetical protein
MPFTGQIRFLQSSHASSPPGHQPQPCLACWARSYRLAPVQRPGWACPFGTCATSGRGAVGRGEPEWSARGRRAARNAGRLARQPCRDSTARDRGRLAREEARQPAARAGVQVNVWCVTAAGTRRVSAEALKRRPRGPGHIPPWGLSGLRRMTASPAGEGAGRGQAMRLCARIWVAAAHASGDGRPDRGGSSVRRQRA